MRPMRTAFAVAMTLTLTVAGPIGMAASDQLDRAKELYRSASYDEALGVLESLPPPADQGEALEVHEYRVFCLVALDRKADAQKAIAALVTASPQYVMSELEASPRVRAMFADVRRSLLPGIVQQAYADAKAAFDRKDPAAVTQFDHVLDLLQDPAVKGNPGLADLLTVATGFRDLSKALATTTPPPVSAAPVPAAAPAPTVAAVVAVIPPVARSQAVPVPQLREQREWNGEIEIVIDPKGKVISARMTAPINPVYDQQLTRAALTWSYTPATRNGVAEQYVKRIPVHVDTRPECNARVSTACRPPSSDR